MARQIEPDTLRQWLDEQRPVTVLDVRPDDERAQWAIPGSLHLNAYHALRSGEAGPLETFSPPSGHTVVTVCGAGRTSQTAADLLSSRGIDASSLMGGMQAWSLAWNTADVPSAGRTGARPPGPPDGQGLPLLRRRFGRPGDRHRSIAAAGGVFEPDG